MPTDQVTRLGDQANEMTMQQNDLFRRTRLQLAGWYAGVMGCILGLCGVGVYQVVAHAYRDTIDQGLASVAEATQHSLEPVLQQPGQLRQLAQQLSLELCQTQANCLTSVQPQPVAAVVAPVSYYLRLSNRVDQPIAIAGLPLDQLPLAPGTSHWLTRTSATGRQYRQISLPLHAQSQRWGSLQVGRSLTDLDQHLAALRLTLMLGCPIALLLIVWSSWWLAGLAMRPIYQSYRQMQQFTADAAHELRTPLAAMQSTIDSALIQSVASPPAALLTTLKRQTVRLSQLVRDLLLLARLEQREVADPPVACHLQDVITDLVEEMASFAIAAKVTLNAQVSQPVEVLGHEDQLYRLVSNLIDNAIKATPAGGCVTVSLHRSESYGRIQVEDTGVGIAPDVQPRIFDRFYRVQPDRSRHTGGSGLGLAIAQAIAQAHGGSIQVQSQPGCGSIFTVQIPLV